MSFTFIEKLMREIMYAERCPQFMGDDECDGLQGCEHCLMRAAQAVAQIARPLRNAGER